MLNAEQLLDSHIILTVFERKSDCGAKEFLKVFIFSYACIVYIFFLACWHRHSSMYDVMFFSSQ